MDSAAAPNAAAKDFVVGMPTWLRYIVDQDGTLQTWVSSLMFWLLVFAVVWWLYRLDKNATKFKLQQFVSDQRGNADKYALGYFIALGVGSWGVWFLISHDRMTEWYWNGYLWAFVVGTAAVGITRAIKAPNALSEEVHTFESRETRTTPADAPTEVPIKEDPK